MTRLGAGGGDTVDGRGVELAGYSLPHVVANVLYSPLRHLLPRVPEL